MVGRQHRLGRHEFEQAPGDSGGQGSLACCSPRGHKELDTTEQLNNHNQVACLRCLNEPSSKHNPCRQHVERSESTM